MSKRGHVAQGQMLQVGPLGDGYRQHPGKAVTKAVEASLRSPQPQETDEEDDPLCEQCQGDRKENPEDHVAWYAQIAVRRR